MIFAAFAPAIADGTASAALSASSTTVNRGSTFTVTVSVTGSAQAKSLMVAPSYDKDVLELTNAVVVAEGTALDDVDSAGKAVMAFKNTTKMDFAAVKYTFKVKADAEFGTTTVSAAITIKNPDCACQSGSKTITIACAHKNTVKTAAKAATCTADGNIEYWTCSDCHKMFSDSACKNVVTSVKTDKLGHNYVDKSDGSQHWQQCTRCNDKKDIANHSFDQQNTASKYLKSEATCKSPAVYYYSCACGAKGTQTFTYGDKAAHDFSKKNTSAKYLKTEATCTEPAVYYYSCAVCGEIGTKTFTGKANGHDFSAWKETGDNHTRVCTVCGEKETEAHTWDRGVVTKQPTTTATGERKYTCKACGATKIEVLDKFEESDIEIKELTLTDNGVTVSGKMQSSAALKVESLEKGSDLYEAAVKAVCDAFKLNSDKALAAYDIRLLVKDVEVQPDGSVTVKMELPANLVGASFDLYAVTTDADGKSVASKVDYKLSADGKEIEFKLDKMGQIVFMDNTVEPEPTPSPAPVEPTEPESNCAWIYILIAVVVAGIIIFIIIKKKKEDK